MMARVGWYNVKLRRKHGAEAWWNDEENEVPIDRQEEENVSCRQVRRLGGGGGDGGGCWCWWSARELLINLPSMVLEMEGSQNVIA